MKKSTKNGLIILAIVAAAGFFLWKKFPMKKGGGNTGGGNTGGGNTGGGNTGGGNTGGSAINAASIADDLFNAMDGYGTGESSIIAAFSKINNDADFDAVWNAFGTRTISSGAGNIFVSDFTGNLGQCLSDELSTSYIDEINYSLADRGISRRINY